MAQGWLSTAYTTGIRDIAGTDSTSSIVNLEESIGTLTFRSSTETTSVSMAVQQMLIVSGVSVNVMRPTTNHGDYAPGAASGL